MFDILSSGFKNVVDKIQGKATLSEENISEAIDGIRQSLLEADVEYQVAKNFISRIKEKSLGEIVNLKAGKKNSKVKVTPGDHFVKICKDELIELMGPVDSYLNLPKEQPAIVMMVGLQGTGKTTTTGKLAKYLIRKNRKPLLVAADIYRPAAIEQLKVLGQKIDVPVFHLENTSPVEICKQSLNKAISLGCDTVLFDTAGRLTVDEKLMDELYQIKKQCQPDNVLLVCDAMMGQDAVTTAKAFNDRLDLSGVIMTKLDGDARGGAALSIKEVTGASIKFIGSGEGLDRLEEFRPEGLAGRILGLGDVVGLMEDFEKVAGEDREEDAMRMLSGKFNFKDFYEQISMIQKMGPLKDVIAKLPMQNMLPKEIDVDGSELVRIKSMIDSMTEKERLQPSLINESRARRIASGSGRKLKDVSELMKKFKSMHSILGQFGKSMGGGLMGKIPGMNQLSQMNQMRKMMSGGGVPNMSSMMNAMGGGATMSAPRKIDREKQKKLRKAAKNSRKKNRRK